MSPRRPTLDEVKAYRLRLGNPYACIEYLEDPLLCSDVELPDLKLRDSQNPYASLPLWTDSGDEPERIGSDGPALSGSESSAGMSKREFREACTRIFRPYIPAHEKGRLRSHHRAFMERNDSRTPRVRALLVRELRRYDLSNVVGIRPQFNREPQDLSEKKLRGIEMRVSALEESSDPV